MQGLWGSYHDHDVYQHLLNAATMASMIEELVKLYFKVIISTNSYLLGPKNNISVIKVLSGLFLPNFVLQTSVALSKTSQALALA